MDIYVLFTILRDFDNLSYCLSIILNINRYSDKMFNLLIKANKFHRIKRDDIMS